MISLSKTILYVKLAILHEVYALIIINVYICESACLKPHLE